MATWLLVSCSPVGVVGTDLSSTVRIRGLRDAAVSWHIAPVALVFRDGALLVNAPRPAATEVAVVRSIVRANPRISPLDALRLATVASIRARAEGLDANFFSATMLQESAFDPFAVSSAGALGIAQFTPETADAYGVDPLDPIDALTGSAHLLGMYVARYRRQGEADPYALALAAYNAGPGAVARYHGVPPYPETRGYIADIADRLAKIARDETRYAPAHERTRPAP